MPLRRSRVDALDVIAYTDGIATLDLVVSSGTYVRSIADALGGHCVALRRTEVGPFSVAGGRRERVIPLDDALGRIGLTVAEAEDERRRKAASDRTQRTRRAARRQRLAQSRRHGEGRRLQRSRRGELASRPGRFRPRPAHPGRSADEDRAPAGAARTPAAGRRDRHVRRRPPRPSQRHPGGDRLRPRADGDHVRPAPADRARQRRRADHDARATAGAARRGRGRGDAGRVVHDRS